MQRGNTLVKVLLITAFFAVTAIMIGIKVKELFMVDFGVLQELQVEKVRLQKLQTELAAAKVARKIQNLDRNHAALLAGGLMLAGGVSVAMVLFGGLTGWGTLRKHSIITEQLGTDCVLQLHYRDIRKPQFLALTGGLVEAQRLRAAYPIEGLEMSLKLMQSTLHAIGGKQGLIPALMSAMPNQPKLAALPSGPIRVPSFAELVRSGEIAAGKPLVMGGSADGALQRRNLQDLKALSVAGWQGSGKTLSMGYLSASLLVQYPESRGYIIDPHMGHDESLADLLRPLEATGRLTIVPTVELPDTMQMLNELLDNRLAGREPSDPLVFLVIDELSRLGKLDIFHKTILPFLERATEEVRKANILFVGAAQKWQARHFGGKADIRQTIPSLLVHKTKPSQAALLLEDNEEKKLVKGLTDAGQAVLSTSHDADPLVVKMPLITPHDIYELSQRLVANGAPITVTMSNGNGNGNVLVTPLETPEETDGNADLTLWDVDVIRTEIIDNINSNGLTWGQLGKETGINKGQLYAVITTDKNMPATMQAALSAWLDAQASPSNVVKFPGKH